MKRGLVLSLCALALGAFAHTANAQVAGSAVKVSLNLRYNDPADPTEGGKFYVVAQATPTGAGFGGLAGLSVHISNIDSASAVFGTVAENGYALSTRTTLADNLAAAGTSPYKTTTGGFVNLVYGQDLSAAGFTPVGTVGKTAHAGNTATDPLRNAAWNNSTVIFSGTFGASRPAFGGVTDANVFSSATAIGQSASITTTVRGDSVASLGLNTPATAGLRPGDANRDGLVNGQDFDLLAFNYQQAGATTWGQGDFNDSGSVNGQDFDILAFNYGGAAPPAPTVAAVPEPGTMVLAGAAVLGLIAARRRTL